MGDMSTRNPFGSFGLFGLFTSPAGCLLCVFWVKIKGLDNVLKVRPRTSFCPQLLACGLEGEFLLLCQILCGAKRKTVASRHFDASFAEIVAIREGVLREKSIVNLKYLLDPEDTRSDIS